MFTWFSNNGWLLVRSILLQLHVPKLMPFGWRSKYSVNYCSNRVIVLISCDMFGQIRMYMVQIHIWLSLVYLMYIVLSVMASIGWIHDSKTTVDTLYRPIHCKYIYYFILFILSLPFQTTFYFLLLCLLLSETIWCFIQCSSFLL